MLPDSLLPSSGAYAQAPPTIEIQAIIRDFKGRGQPGGHQDFERTKATNTGGLTAGALASTLDSDRKPVFAGSTKLERSGGYYSQWKDSSGREISFTGGPLLFAYCLISEPP